MTLAFILNMKDGGKAGETAKVVQVEGDSVWLDNFLRHSTIYKIGPEDRSALEKIARKTGINFIRDMLIDTGYLLPNPHPERNRISCSMHTLT